MKQRKNKLNNILKFGVFLFGISLLLWNCEKPNGEIPPQNESKLKISDKSFKEYLTNEKFIKAIEEIKPSKLQSKSSDDLYNFTIDSTNVREIREGSQTSYTFFIKRENQDPSFFENLVVKVDSLNNTEAFLFKYEPSENVQFFELHNSLNFKGNVNITKLNTENLNLFAKVACITVTTTYCSETGQGDSGAYYNHTHIANSDCHNPEFFTSVSHEICFNTIGGSGGFSTGDYTGGGNGGTDNGSNNNNVNSSPITYPCGDSIHGCSKKADIISSRLGLNGAERNWLRDQSETIILGFEIFLDDNGYSVEAKNWVKGQIELEMLTQNIPWNPSVGYIGNLKYTHSYFDGSRGYYKLEDGSIVVTSSSEQTLTFSGELRDKYNEFNPNDRFYYIKLPNKEWAEMLFNPSSLTDQLGDLFKLAGLELGRSIGRYVLPIEDIKVIIDGTDFDGQKVERWKAAGFLLLTIVPGSKALKIVTNASEALVVAVKIGSNVLVIDTIRTGLKIVANSSSIKFLSQSGDEVARVINNIMTFKYTGFGGDIITTANKTTTVIGRWQNQIENIWSTGLAKQGSNIGGMNILGEVSGTIQQQWNLNRQWLNQAIARGDVIRVTANPLNIDNVFHITTGIPNSAFQSITSLKNLLLSLSPNDVENLGFYGKEIRHLFQNGYNFNSTTKQFTR